MFGWNNSVLPPVKEEKKNARSHKQLQFDAPPVSQVLQFPEVAQVFIPIDFEALEQREI